MEQEAFSVCTRTCACVHACVSGACERVYEMRQRGKTTSGANGGICLTIEGLLLVNALIQLRCCFDDVYQVALMQLSGESLKNRTCSPKLYKGAARPVASALCSGLYAAL